MPIWRSLCRIHLEIDRGECPVVAARARAKAAAAAGTTPAPPVPWSVHDLRRTVATGLQRLGVRLEVTEAVLNHISRGCW
jgi:integrase